MEEIKKNVFLNYKKCEKFKTNFISVSFLSNLSIQTASFNSLILNVLKRGSVNFPSIERINVELSELYGALFKTNVKKLGEMHTCTFTMEFLKQSFTINGENSTARSLNFINDILKNPLAINCKFDDEIVKTEKENLISHINSTINDKKIYSLNRCIEIMCNDEAYGTSEFGAIDFISKIDSKTLYNEYLRFINDSIIVIDFVGDASFEYLTDFFSGMFADRDFENIITQPIVPKKTKDIIETLPVNQGKLTIGFRTNITPSADNFIALVVLNVIFGATPTSRLFLNVRERLSLCYYCASILEKNKGLMFVYSGVENKNMTDALNEIIRQLEDIKSGNITNQELEVAKTFIINQYISLEDDKIQKTIFNLVQFIASSKKTNLDYIEEVKYITIEDVIEVSKTVLIDTIYFLKGEENAD